MNLNILGALKAKLDEPFTEPASSVALENLSCVVVTPLGDELIDPAELDEPTVMMSLDTIKKLVYECSEKRTTVQMPAVRVA